MKSFSRYVVLMALFLCSATAFAASIKGIIKDTSGEPLMEATVRLLLARDSSFVKGTTADMNGRFTIGNVKKGRYIVQSTYIGYTPSYQNVSVGENDVRLKLWGRLK